MFQTLFNTSVISGKFIDRENDGVCETPDISEQDLNNYLNGNWNLLTRKQIAFLKQCEDDPEGVKWNREHANLIFCHPDWFFMILFVYFPYNNSWEENYQALRRLIGPQPLNYTNVIMAVNGK